MTPEKDKEIHKILDFLHFCESHDLSIPRGTDLEYIMVEYFSLSHEEARKIIAIFWEGQEKKEEALWKAPDRPTRGLMS